MAPGSVSLLVLLATSLLNAPQARLLKVRSVPASSADEGDSNATVQIADTDMVGNVAPPSDARADSTAEFDDAVDDARAEAGAAADADMSDETTTQATEGEDDADEQDHTKVQGRAKLVGEVDDVQEDMEAEAGEHPEVEQQAADSLDADDALDDTVDSQQGVYNLETGRFEKATVLLQIGDVEDTDEQDEASDDEEEETASDDTDPNQDKVSNSESFVQTGDVDDDDEEETVSDDTDPNEDEVSNSESFVQTGDVDDDDEEDETMSDDTDPNEDKVSHSELFAQTSDDDDEDGSDSDVADFDSEDAAAAEAEALKPWGRVATGEREEAEQEGVEAMDAGSEYDLR